jgi:hypothetical protein
MVRCPGTALLAELSKRVLRYILIMDNGPPSMLPLRPNEPVWIRVLRQRLKETTEQLRKSERENMRLRLELGCLNQRFIKAIRMGRHGNT